MQQKEDKISLAPTDLSNFLSCRHSSRRDLQAVMGGDTRPVRYGPVLDALKERGRKHEKSYLEHLRGNRLSVVEASDSESSNTAHVTSNCHRL